MKRVPILKDGVVVNVAAVADGAEWTPPPDCTIGPDGGSMGDTWDGKAYSRPAPAPKPAPRVDTRTTAQKLASIGVTLDELRKALSV